MVHPDFQIDNIYKIIAKKANRYKNYNENP